jgi:hypothetical protein
MHVFRTLCGAVDVRKQLDKATCEGNVGTVLPVGTPTLPWSPGCDGLTNALAVAAFPNTTLVSDMRTFARVGHSSSALSGPQNVASSDYSSAEKIHGNCRVQLLFHAALCEAATWCAYWSQGGNSFLEGRAQNSCSSRRQHMGGRWTRQRAMSAAAWDDGSVVPGWARGSSNSANLDIFAKGTRGLPRRPQTWSGDHNANMHDQGVYARPAPCAIERSMMPMPSKGNFDDGAARMMRSYATPAIAMIGSTAFSLTGAINSVTPDVLVGNDYLSPSAACATRAKSWANDCISSSGDRFCPAQIDLHAQEQALDACHWLNLA